jgi:hypothetical protein
VFRPPASIIHHARLSLACQLCGFRLLMATASRPSVATAALYRVECNGIREIVETLRTDTVFLSSRKQVLRSRIRGAICHFLPGPATACISHASWYTNVAGSGDVGSEVPETGASFRLAMPG